MVDNNNKNNNNSFLFLLFLSESLDLLELEWQRRTDSGLGDCDFWQKKPRTKCCTEAVSLSIAANCASFVLYLCFSFPLVCVYNYNNYEFEDWIGWLYFIVNRLLVTSKWKIKEKSRKSTLSHVPVPHELGFFLKNGCLIYDKQVRYHYPTCVRETPHLWMIFIRINSLFYLSFFFFFPSLMNKIW